MGYSDELYNSWFSKQTEIHSRPQIRGSYMSGTFLRFDFKLFLTNWLIAVLISAKRLSWLWLRIVISHYTKLARFLLGMTRFQVNFNDFRNGGVQRWQKSGHFLNWFKNWSYKMTWIRKVLLIQYVLKKIWKISHWAIFVQSTLLQLPNFNSR